MINSVVWLHMQYDNLWNGINVALPQVLGELCTFVETLSPITDDIADQKKQKLILDDIQMGLFMIVEPAFNSGSARLKAIEWVKSNWVPGLIHRNDFAFVRI